MGSIYVICSRQCPNGDGIYTLLYALYKYSTSITNQPTNVNSNWSYSPETAKLGCDLCDLDLWPLTLTFCMDVTLVRGDNSWKFHDDTMMGT